MKNLWDSLYDIFFETAKKFPKDRISPHAKGRTKSPTWREKRRARQQMAKASRKRNR